MLPADRRRPRVAALLTALLAAGVIGGVAATAVASGSGAGAAPGQERQDGWSAGQVAELAREAITDDEALDDLRAVDGIDERPVDLDAALAGLGEGTDGARAERLTALADALDGGSGADVGADPAASRDAARRVLDDDKFQEDQVPRPFKGVLEWIADRLRPVGDLLDRVFGPILDLPGGPFVLGALLVGAGAAGVAWLIGRRSRAAVAAEGAAGLVDPTLDPADLDRRADRAETAGDLARALRLRYQAGLLRLARDGRLVLRPDTTASGAAEQVDDAALHRITATFEAVAYGGRSPSPDELREARADWAAVLGVGSRR